MKDLTFQKFELKGDNFIRAGETFMKALDKYLKQQHQLVRRSGQPRMG